MKKNEQKDKAKMLSFSSNLFREYQGATWIFEGFKDVPVKYQQAGWNVEVTRRGRKLWTWVSRRVRMANDDYKQFMGPRSLTLEKEKAHSHRMGPYERGVQCMHRPLYLRHRVF